MQLEEFIARYDVPEAIVLLEGKREVKECDKEKLVELGRLLAQSTHHMLFRSGNADGSDYLFSSGVASVNANRLQVIAPYAGHRKKQNKAGHTVSLDQFQKEDLTEIIALTKENKKYVPMMTAFESGAKGNASIKAAYILRDTIKVTGAGEVAPASVGMFYDDLQKPRTGGTGHTMWICDRINVPVLDQQSYFAWLS